jgi:outer membrane protein TolC
MNFFRLLIFGTWLTVFPVIMSAQENTGPLKLSLKQAQEYALQNNKSILNANLDVEMAKKKVWETTSTGLPQISGVVSASYILTMPGLYEQFVRPQIEAQVPSDQLNREAYVNNLVKESLDSMRYSGTLDFTVSQLIFSGSYIVGLQASKVYKSLSELNRVKSVQDVMESVSNTYFMVLVARENALILDSTRLNLEKTYSEMTQMNKQGFIEETDVDQINITLTNIKSSLDLIKRQVEISERLLKIQLGVNIDQPVELTDNLTSLVNTLTYEPLLLAELVLDNNVSYQMLDAQVKSSELLLKLNKSESLPTISAFYQHEELLNNTSITFTPPDLVGLTVNIPIFSSGGRWAKVKQAKMDLEKSKNTRDQTSDMIRLEYFQSKSALVSAKEKFESDKKNLELSKKIYDRSLIKFQNGMISSTDLTQIQNQYLTAQSTYYQSLQNLITEKNKLEKILTKN